ncbi:RDD family protein [Streptomyces sp. NBC_00306]|nr:hypothetical protein [Streptomyces sp. NBC_00306]
MSFGDPNNPYNQQPPQGQPGYPQQGPQDVPDSIACYLGWLWPLWDAKKQTFADKVCNTVVVKVPKG